MCFALQHLRSFPAAAPHRAVLTAVEPRRRRIPTEQRGEGLGQHRGPRAALLARAGVVWIRSREVPADHTTEEARTCMYWLPGIYAVHAQVAWPVGWVCTLRAEHLFQQADATTLTTSKRQHNTHSDRGMHSSERNWPSSRARGG